MPDRYAWAEIDLGAIAHNYREIKKCLQPGTKLCAVVKANAYGHGALAVARQALEAGAACLAVATLPEASELRDAGFTAPILILGLVPEEAAGQIVERGLTSTVCAIEQGAALSREAVRQGKKAKIHLKIDTGMGRIGARPEEAAALAAELHKMPGLDLEGAFSHFASADTKDKTSARRQLARFKQATDAIEATVGKIPLKHIAESAAILEMPEAHLDMARAGIIQYGLWPSDEVAHTIDLRPAMKLCAKLAFIKDVRPGESISYGGEFIARRPSRIATLPLGYADGYIRAYAKRGAIELYGRRAPIAGRICMDQFMVDVTDIPEAKTGDTAVLFGSTSLTADEAATWLGTINYEVTCLVSARVPRVYAE